MSVGVTGDIVHELRRIADEIDTGVTLAEGGTHAMPGARSEVARRALEAARKDAALVRTAADLVSLLRAKGADDQAVVTHLRAQLETARRGRADST